MKTQKMLWLLILLITGCSTVNCTITGSDNKVSIEQPKTVTTSPAVSGNTVPVVP